MSVPRALVQGVDLLCLDAGNTVIFLDHARLSGLLREVGLSTSAETLIATEGQAKRLAETAELVDVDWQGRERPGAAGWGRMVGTIVAQAGLPAADLPAFLEYAWRSHEAKNLWSCVPPGLGEALDPMRAGGVAVAIVSNSEGMLEELFTALDVLRHFDAVVDSAKVGFEKPDRRIFEVALARFGVPPNRALHLGDFFATDVVGARAAGLRHALVDPYGHYEGRHPEVPRVPDVASVARAIIASRAH
jgi:HAD superfamily hydrolase (TIGR01509 family)